MNVKGVITLHLNYVMNACRFIASSMVLVAAAIMGGVLSGCEVASHSVSEADGSLLRVTTTTGMIADTARIVGGEAVLVEQLMGPGVDPHLYKATQSDLHRLTNADIILYNGLHLEGRMVDIMSRMDRYTESMAVAEAVPEELLRILDDYPGNQDPHIWFDLSLWRYAVEAIRDRFIALRPEEEAYFRARTDAFLSEMADLHDWAKVEIQRIPKDSRVLITAHDAFGYFGEAYDIEVMGLQGISTASEYGLQDMERLVQIIIERDIKAIFVESSISTRGMEALLAGVRARGQTLQIGGELYGDALGEPGTPVGTYLGMFRHNVVTIVEALR